MKTFKNREEYVINMLKKYSSQTTSKTLSDIGSGMGWLKPIAEEFKFEWQPFDSVRKIDAAIIWDLNLPCPPIADRAGICVFLEVLEHLPNPLLSIQNIANHLLPGAVLIMSVPNPSWSRNRLNHLLKGALFSFQKKHLEEHHVFTTWRHIVEYFFVESGFEILEYQAIDPHEIKPKSIKSFVLSKLQKIIEKRDPTAVGLSYGLVLRKKGND